MSEEKIDGNTQYPVEEKLEFGDKNDEPDKEDKEEGEIDDEPEVQKSALINFPIRKINKNLRSREKSESDEVGTSGKSP